MDPQFVKSLLAWYGVSARDLPWRGTDDPYAVWVSEIMLQQTRVEAVKEYYERFMEALPDIAALAACPEDELLKLWEGLGYYSRVRNMQKAARQIMDDYGGKMPSGAAELRKLAGIGEYTAGAIASIAFGQREPAIDGNVLRVSARVLGIREVVTKPAVKKQIREALLATDDGRVDWGRLNQAFMDLSSAVCLVVRPPLCEACPVAEYCVARREGLTDQIPDRGVKAGRRVEERTVLILLDGDRMAIRRRPAKGLLAGLYEFPAVTGWLDADGAVREAERLGFMALHVRPLPAARHIFTHLTWEMQAYEIKIAPRGEEYEKQLIFADPAAIEDRYPLPGALEAYASLYGIRIGRRKKEEET